MIHTRSKRTASPRAWNRKVRRPEQGTQRLKPFLSWFVQDEKCDMAGLC